MERKGGFPCPPRLESGPSEAEKEVLEVVPQADHCSNCQEDLLLVGALGPGWDPGRAQVGHLGWLGERLPGKAVEGHHRPGKALSLGGFELAG